MSDAGKTPEPTATAPTTTETRSEKAPVGDVSGEPVKVTDETGVPATESKEEKSVLDEAQDSETKPSESEKLAQPAEDESKNDASSANIGDSTISAAPGAHSGSAGEMTPVSKSKDSKGRRKSSGGGTPMNKQLKKKQSRLALAHLHAKPGDYYYIKFKGSQPWPGIVASEEMLPEAIKKMRPVTAARPDGSYREDMAEGGKNVLDRTYPCMFFHTNEFAWVPNTDLVDLDVNTVADVKRSKMSNALTAAHQIAAENHPLEYFVDMLKEHEELARQEEEEREAAAAEKEAAAASKAASKSKKKSSKSKNTVSDEDEDVEMADADDSESKPKSKKRKAAADEDGGVGTPAKDSAKKPKLKLTHTPKANGTDTPKSAASKEKKEKKPKATKKANGETPAKKEASVDPETARKNKEKEVLFLRHKLQKGLLSRDEKPKEEEMKQMSEYITKLEGYADLEVATIRATKINKVLKALLKLEEIPKEAEFKFKERSTSLLAKWNKILESDGVPAAQAQANGEKKELANGAGESEEAKSAEPEKKEEEPAEAAKDADTEMKDSDAEKPAEEETKAEKELEAKEGEKTETEEKKETETAEPATVEASA